MEQYFEKQTHLTNLMMMVETTIINNDGSKNVKLELTNLGRHEIADLNKNYEFIRMATDAVPVFRKV